ncbi:hypothetical protein [Paraglaciecola sp.]|uniref:hypothetical protein n=1 Tax=Paraglaciecola sp. TaxID=1920173 RepID=UPI0030F38D2B
MSNFSNVYDFLLHNQKLHARIAEFYRRLALDASNERVKMLLSLLVKHELQLLNSMGQYIEKASANVRDTFIQFDREQSVEHLFSTDFDRSQIDSDEVENIAQRFDQYLSELYQGMLEAVECEKVKDLFENLRQHMEEEKKRLSTDVNSMADM